VDDSSILFLAAFLLIVVSGATWVMLRRHSRRLSRIDEELSAISALLSKMPREDRIKNYMLPQHQLARAIMEKLESLADTEVLKQYIQDQANHIITIIATHDESRKIAATKAQLERSLRTTNGVLERLLWALRFDEETYTKDAGAHIDNQEESENRHANRATIGAVASDNHDDVDAMKSILGEDNNGDDDYSAMLKYMQQSGKSGSEALQLLEATRGKQNH
jgi:hypothetical protein